MPRPRPDPAAAGARVSALVAPVRGGWTPPPEPGQPLPAVAPEWPPADMPTEHPPPARRTAPRAQAAAVPAAAAPLDDADPARSWSTGEPEPAADAPPGRLAGWLPVPLCGGRWDPGRRGLAALAVVALLAALAAGLLLMRGRPQEVAPPAAVSSGVAASNAPGAVVVVDVDGKVRRPGIVRLPLGARVDDALRAAGGPLPGATLVGLNLARKLADGEQVLVGVDAAAAAPGAAPGAPAGVDLNTADATALDALPGIGPVLAQHIVDWRTEHGRFASVDQLREVPGIGESKFASLKSKVRV